MSIIYPRAKFISRILLISKKIFFIYLGLVCTYRSNSSYRQFRHVRIVVLILNDDYYFNSFHCIYCITLEKLSDNRIHDFSVLLRNGSNPADINRFRSHTEKKSVCQVAKITNNCIDKILIFQGSHIKDLNKFKW